MVSETGKTQVANNSIGIYGKMNKYAGKYPLVYIKHAIQFVLFVPDSWWLYSDPVRR